MFKFVYFSITFITLT